MISTILEGIGMALISAAAFQTAIPLGLFVTGIFTVLIGFSFTDKAGK
jgi:hypothetical protein